MTSEVRRHRFNAYVRYCARAGHPINSEREEFHQYLDCLAGTAMPLKERDRLWDGFIQEKDARDLRDTQGDALW